MPRIRRAGEKAYDRELRVYVIHDSDSGEYLGSNGFWRISAADARVFKRMADAMNSLHWLSFKALKDRALQVKTLYVDHSRTETVDLIVEETAYEMRERERREGNVQTGGVLSGRW